jgi:Ala-tRNA(Pro) deacylase
VPASSKVDLDALGKLAGAGEVRLAEEHEFADLFPDCDVGAMPPFGNLYDLPLWLDKSFDTCEYVVFNAGTHTDTVKMSLEDFKRLASPQSGHIAATD